MNKTIINIELPSESSQVVSADDKPLLHRKKYSKPLRRRLKSSPKGLRFYDLGLIWYEDHYREVTYEQQAVIEILSPYDQIGAPDPRPTNEFFDVVYSQYTSLTKQQLKERYYQIKKEDVDTYGFIVLGNRTYTQDDMQEDVMIIEPTDNLQLFDIIINQDKIRGWWEHISLGEVGTNPFDETIMPKITELPYATAPAATFDPSGDMDIFLVPTIKEGLLQYTAGVNLFHTYIAKYRVHTRRNWLFPDYLYYHLSLIQHHPPFPESLAYSQAYYPGLFLLRSDVNVVPQANNYIDISNVMFEDTRGAVSTFGGFRPIRDNYGIADNHVNKTGLVAIIYKNDNPYYVWY